MTNPPNTACELRDVSFSFGDHIVLESIDWTVPTGSLVCVIGPNGAGKSTLLRLMAGFITPTQGVVRTLGMNPANTDRTALAKRMAYVSQHYHQVFPFTARDIVLMGRYAHRRRRMFDVDRDEDLDAALAALARCDASELADRRFDQLSGGEQRRVLLAQALCQNAELILLDEPTASLDPAHGLALFRALRNSDPMPTVVVVTHDLNLAARFADTIVLVDKRRITATGGVEVFRGEAIRDAFGVSLHTGTLPGTNDCFVVP